MSPRRWWRPRPSAGDEPRGPAPAVLSATAGPAIDRLLVLALQRVTGALEFGTGASGTVYLVDGCVSHVQAPDVPGLELRVLHYVDEGHAAGEAAIARAREAIRGESVPPVRLHALLHDVVADAALAVLGTRDPAYAGTRFVAGEEHWATLPQPPPVAELLAEVTRRQRVLAALAPLAGPDEAVSRTVELPVQDIRFSGHQWDLVRLADGRATPRTMARTLGRGVFASTVAVAGLVEAGALEAATAPAGTRASMPFLVAVEPGAAG